MENSTVGDNLDKLLHENITEEILSKLPPTKKGVSFYGAATVEFTTTPTKSENNTANATLGFGFSGAARNAATTFAKLGDETAKLFTIIGNDSLGDVMKSDLEKNGVDTQYIDTDKKLPTASKIVMKVEKEYVEKEIGENATEAKEDAPEKKTDDKQDAKKTDNENNTELVQYNYDILHRVAYKYLYPHMRAINDSELVYADMMVTENSIKALVNNFGEKLFLQAVDVQNLAKYLNVLRAHEADVKVNKKKADPPFLVDSLYLTLEQAVVVPKTFCEHLNAQKDLCKDHKDMNLLKLLVEDYAAQKRRPAYADYLQKHSDEIRDAMYFL